MYKKYSFLPIILSVFISCSSHKTPKEDTYKTAENITNISDTIKNNHPLGQQLLVVITPDWNLAQGSLHRFEYTQGNWQKTGESIPIVVGKKGMAWGKGIMEMDELMPMEGPVKKEGDLKSPAGMFRLEAAFGYAPIEAVQWIKSPYISVKSYTQCIEDIDSRYYNQIVADTIIDADWNSTDHMLRKDDLYEWGMVVAHNTGDAEAGAGSCIFLHVGNPQGKGTAGCTAMEKAQIRKLLSWIDPAQRPLLVQVPVFAYSAFQQKFGLAEI